VERPSWERDIRPLFRAADRDAMIDTLDLWSVEDVRGWLGLILERLDDGTMPCDEPWPPHQIALFRQWVDAGSPH
jgi:hypothetical protein